MSKGIKKNTHTHTLQ